MKELCINLISIKYVIIRTQIFMQKLLLNMHIFMHPKCQKYIKNMQKNFYCVYSKKE